MLPLNIDPTWLEEQYRIWQAAPERLTAEWRAFFRGFEIAAASAAEPAPADYCRKQTAVEALIIRHREMGHLLACTDPLHSCPTEHPLLSVAAFGLREDDLDTVFHAGGFNTTLREIVALLRTTYCRAIGVEYMHIQSPEIREWLRERMEYSRNVPAFRYEEKLRILGKLQEGVEFETFLHRRFLGQKRFSLEGGEVLIPMLDRVVRTAARLGSKNVILGMPHRGRLNVLANIFGKPYENIFQEFRDDPSQSVSEGDVKYHKGFSADVMTESGEMHLTIASNPSHLEAVDPVVEGKVRARQDKYRDPDGDLVLPVLLHGDAAMAGQGIVPETLNLSQLEGYRTGGTLHIVINNQIGFTTLPHDSRSFCYATDWAKAISSPVFHVHGENPEAAQYAVELALEYRRRFRQDVFIDVTCYRRHGHNEGDEPYFTQPLMYDRIKNRPTVAELYAGQLVEEGVPEAVPAESLQRVKKRLEDAFRAEAKPLVNGYGGIWNHIRREFSFEDVATGVPAGRLRELNSLITAIPEDFTPHRKIADLMRRRRESIDSDDGIDWGTAETLAYATLVAGGRTVRLSGQDTRRGTFNHRHAVLFDVTDGRRYIPLERAEEQGGRFHAYDSPLSEEAVLGFEYGYSLETPDGLVIWEAQFGDFVNVGQSIIDQFIAAGEAKWDRSTGLALFLPHGYEGQGAEHSSGRVERFLQLCGGNNMVVVYPTTPAQMFHLLRRQVLQSFRKPLVVFTPKSLLRHPRCRSRLDDLVSLRFQEILDDTVAAEKVTKVLVCSGKVYYDLLEKREAVGRSDVAIIRVEQLYPLRWDALAEVLWRYPEGCRVAWVQEEPANMGAWTYIRPHLAEILGREPEYVGRKESAVPAVASHHLHAVEQEELLRRAFENA